MLKLRKNMIEYIEAATINTSVVVLILMNFNHKIILNSFKKYYNFCGFYINLEIKSTNIF